MSNSLHFMRVGAAMRRATIPLMLAFVAACGGGGDGGGDAGSGAGAGNGGGGGSGNQGSGIGSFSALAEMGTPRFSPASALLPSGKVLVAGGFRSSSESLATAEVFDPATGQWAAAPSMAVKRASGLNYGFLTRLMDGRILALSSTGAEIYDETTSRWTAAATPPNTLSGPYVSLPDGRVLGWSAFLRQALFYDPSTNSWSAANGFDGRTKFSAVVLADGRVLLSGGQLAGQTDRTLTTLILNPNAGTWQAGPSMNFARSDHFSFRLDDGRIVVSHGVVTTKTMAGTTEVFQPATGAWVIGGNVHKFDSTTTSASGTPIGGGRFLVAGGRAVGGGVILDQKVQGLLDETNAEIFEPSTLSWRRATAEATGLVQPRYAHTATRLTDGRVLLAGGLVGIDAITAVEAFRP